jgi:hypothetical protein
MGGLIGSLADDVISKYRMKKVLREGEHSDPA